MNNVVDLDSYRRKPSNERQTYETTAMFALPPLWSVRFLVGMMRKTPNIVAAPAVHRAPAIVIEFPSELGRLSRHPRI